MYSAKNVLRSRIRKNREDYVKSLGESECLNLNKKLVQNILDVLPETMKGPISGFWPLSFEPDVRPVLEAVVRKGRKVLLPVIQESGASLIFRSWKPGDCLQESSFKTMEPLASVPTYDPEILLVPVLAFDGRGHRLGYGAGHYDRTLLGFQKKKIKVFTIGVAFEMQRVNELPMASYDQPLHWVVTEEKVYKFM